jgi:hypothetical protein
MSVAAGTHTEGSVGLTSAGGLVAHGARQQRDRARVSAASASSDRSFDVSQLVAIEDEERESLIGADQARQLT